MRKTLSHAAAAAGAVLVCGAASATYAHAHTTGPETSDRLLVVYAHVSDGLAPGMTLPVAYTADNPGDKAVRVGTVTASVSIESAHAATCSPEYITVRPHESNTTVPAGAKGAQLGVSIITFEESAQNQDGCQGATIGLSITAR